MKKTLFPMIFVALISNAYTVKASDFHPNQALDPEDLDQLLRTFENAGSPIQTPYQGIGSAEERQHQQAKLDQRRDQKPLTPEEWEQRQQNSTLATYECKKCGGLLFSGLTQIQAHKRDSHPKSTYGPTCGKITTHEKNKRSDSEPEQ